MADRRALLLLRHGRTAWNLERRIQGHLDAGLDETGHAQARAAAKEIAPRRPALLWSSDLTRAADTATYVGEACGLEVVTDPRLREYHLGSMQGRLYAEVAETDPEAFERFRRGDFEADDGESTATWAPGWPRRCVTCSRRPRRDGCPWPSRTARRSGSGSPRRWAGARRSASPSAPSVNCGWAVLTEDEPDGRLRLNSYNRMAPTTADAADFASPPSVG